MAINDTKSWFYVSATGQVLEVPEGDSPPSGSTVLVAPGGTIPDELAKKYGVVDKLKGARKTPPVRRDGAGNPLVVRGGKAYAASVLAEDDEDRKEVEAAAKAEDEAKAKAKANANAKKADAGKEDADDDGDADEPGVKVEAEGKAVRPGRDGVEDKAARGPDARKGPNPPRRK